MQAPKDSPSFKEISNIKMNNLQQETMKILVEDDNKIEKLRGGKMSITMDESDKEIKINKDKKENKVNNFTFKQKLQNNKKLKTIQKNGPIDINPYFSFLQTEQTKYTKPISVLMKLPSDPDPKLKKEIENLETKREGFESKLFKKAKEEFKLITALTKKELQMNLNHELLPFFIVSKNGMKEVNSIVKKYVPSQTKNTKARFLEVNENELKEKFPHFVNDQAQLNKKVYSGLLKFFLGSENEIVDNTRLNKDENKEKVNDNNDNDLLKNEVDFNIEKCLELAVNFKHINCDSLNKDYNHLNDYLQTSFMQLQTTQADQDLVNVKFAASDEPYPTIEKLVAQMMTRRDLAEKFERLKILEYESHLQKAENEMIQDIMHEEVFRIMAFYGPSIEGMVEHIRS